MVMGCFKTGQMPQQMEVTMNQDIESIDWEDKNDAISDHFRVHEALWLPSWRIYHDPSDAEKSEIVITASKMERIRSFFSAPIFVHCWIRPVKVNAPDTGRHEENYNLAIGSTSLKSAHIFGKAIDFHIGGMQGPEKCGQARQMMLPYLEEWDIRMEDIHGGWIHIDTNPVGNRRFFKP